MKRCHAFHMKYLSWKRRSCCVKITRAMRSGVAWMPPLLRCRRCCKETAREGLGHSRSCQRRPSTTRAVTTGQLRSLSAPSPTTWRSPGDKQREDRMKHLEQAIPPAYTTTATRMTPVAKMTPPFKASPPVGTAPTTKFIPHSKAIPPTSVIPRMTTPAQVHGVLVRKVMSVA